MRCAARYSTGLCATFKDRNTDADPDELMKLIDEAVEWLRADPA